jgi:hypothetical protein
MQENLTASQAWRKSGSSLPFKQWIEREKMRDAFLLNKPAQTEFNQALNADGQSTTDNPPGKPLSTTKKIVMVGISIVAVVLIVKLFKSTA